ncbi:putative LRR receptor-like serine/threonine-protein kinase [Acorus calamus]|uniref:LRR receptor-like serine/threonine-protein kinase n=1 Tax=Acorus calamus TaxID=4465 RepID=A0AAV9CMA7_ACOCL|nr:putative LRR receptor-like serine/threonine-protein kinase [Acorus calamus]
MGSLRPLLLLLAFLGSLLLSCDSFSYDEVTALVAIKEAIYEDPLSFLSGWSTLDKNPCDWRGVICYQDHVQILNLTKFSLRGFLSPELGKLTFLQQLILRNNTFVGTIPQQIGMLKNLTVLDLSSNQLSGPIPPEIRGLTSLMKINLRSNGLSGSIPKELGNLMNLVELNLDRNKFRGSIPGKTGSSFSSDNRRRFASHMNATGFCQSSQLKNADFSYNFFVGSIPQCLKYLPRSSFQGNCFHDEYSILQRSAQQCAGVQPIKPPSRSIIGHIHQKARQPTWLFGLEIVTGAFLFCFIIVAVMRAIKSCKPKSSAIIPWKKTSSGKDQTALSIDGELLKDVPRLSRQELEVACEDFSNIIGSSHDSIVYKGTMKDGPEIAVISLCISEELWTNCLELCFQTEVIDLARLNHENTSKLLGYCKEGNPFTRMLVFEYASNGTLYEHLHYVEDCQFSWTRRMRIAIGIARGLRYMHTELEPPFTISELNSSSVYLTEDFSPKLVDFESWKMMLTKSEKNSGIICNGGAYHGLPEALERRHMDMQSNIFAFGVLLLEIISGRPPYCKDKGCVVDWAAQYLGQPEMMCHLVDPGLRYFNHDNLRIVCEVVGLCIQPNPSKRPSMQILTSMLENGIDTSATADLKESPLAWAELALSS